MAHSGLRPLRSGMRKLKKAYGASDRKKHYVSRKGLAGKIRMYRKSIFLGRSGARRAIKSGDLLKTMYADSTSTSRY